MAEMNQQQPGGVAYDVVLTGNINAYADRDQVIAGFQARFKLGEEKAAKLFNGKPTVIKRGLDKAAAEKYLQVLNRLGVDAHLQSTGEETNASAEQNDAPMMSVAAHGSDTPVLASIPVQEIPATPGYRFTIEGRPDYAFVTVQVPANETLKVEASAMATMDTHIKMKTKLRGGLGRFITGESLFINEFTSQGGPGEIGIAPGVPGDLKHIYLDGDENDTIYLQNSAYVASTEGVNVETKWQGLTKGFFSGENLFLIRCQGRGDVWFSSYGGIVDIDVSGDYVVDTGNIVAFTEGLEYRISKVGGYKSLFFSGEGFVCRFSGTGKVWIQTRKAGAFVAWAHPYRPAARG